MMLTFDALLVLARAWLAALVVLISLGCATAPRPPAPGPEASALSRAALDTLERGACPRLLARTFPLGEAVSTGRLWVHVITLSGTGEQLLPPLPCPWVLVTGARADQAVAVALVLTERAERTVASSTRHWVRATLQAYDLSAATPASGPKSGGGSLAVAFAVGPEGAPRSLGRALPGSKSPSVGLVAPLFEVARGAPIVVLALEQHPRPPSLFNATPGYEETLFARGDLASMTGPKRQEHTVTLSRDGRPVGWARFAFESMDIE